ncbi:MAG TPA: hypothetical protein VIL88_09230 [Devosia sp.]|jgi:hypothetical protein|uniref:hypothetical protein n=1 Tax=Devosia sp. TaxID=1871048 RepID=UPI002F9370D9
MKQSTFLVAAGLMLAAFPSFAQEWGSDYNMGSIGVLGGTEADGTISIDCAESGNAVVPQGSLSIFLNPAVRAEGADAAATELTFSVDGTDVVLPVTREGGEAFVFSKMPETLDQATQLIDLLETGEELVVTADGEHLARIGLEGAGAALDGVEVCLES